MNNYLSLAEIVLDEHKKVLMDVNPEEVETLLDGNCIGKEYKGLRNGQDEMLSPGLYHEVDARGI